MRVSDPARAVEVLKTHPQAIGVTVVEGNWIEVQGACAEKWIETLVAQHLTPAEVHAGNRGLESYFLELTDEKQNGGADAPDPEGL